LTVFELAEEMLDLCDTESEIVYEPLPEDDPSRRQPNLTKARELLDFNPTVDLRDGLSRTVKQFSETDDYLR